MDPLARLRGFFARLGFIARYAGVCILVLANSSAAKEARPEEPQLLPPISAEASPWVEQLKSSDPDQIRIAIRELQRLGPKAVGAANELIGGFFYWDLEPEDHDIYDAAADALVAMGPEITYAVLLVIRSDEFGERGVEILERIGPSVGSYLLTALENEKGEYGYFEDIAPLLDSFPELAPKALPILKQNLRKDDRYHMEAAASAILSWSPADAEAAAVLLDRLATADSLTQQNIVALLSQASTDCTGRLIPALRELARTEDSLAAIWAMTTLARLDVQNRGEWVAKLIGMSGNPDHPFRGSAVISLASLATHTPAALDELRRLHLHATGETRLDIAGTLLAADAESKEAQETVLSFIRSADDWDLTSALLVLDELGEKGRFALPELEKLKCEDPETMVDVRSTIRRIRHAVNLTK